MGKIARFFDKMVTIWTILFDIVIGGILSVFAVAILFADLYSYGNCWNGLGLSVIAIVIVNAVNFAVKIFLRSFKK